MKDSCLVSKESLGKWDRSFAFTMIALAFGLLLSGKLIAQIGVGTTTPHPSAMLHISAGAGNNKGLIMPKITSTSRVVLDSTQNIAHGLIFFDTDLQKFYYFHQAPKQWFELDHDWIRKDVAGASPVVGTHIYSGVPGNVGIGTAANVNPGSKLTVVGNLAVGSASYTQDSVAPANGATFGTFVGIGTRNQPSGVILNVKGNSRVQGNEVVTGTVTATEFFGQGVVPPGGIIMFSGPVAGNFNLTTGVGLAGTQYDGWALCDGHNFRPDLRGRFVVGMSNNDVTNYAYTNTEKNAPEYLVIGNNGGRDSTALTVSNLPAHTHTGTTNTDGSHRHMIKMDNVQGGVTYAYNIPECFQSDQDYEIPTNTDGAHNHDFTTDPTGGGTKHENRPPYYVLAYIIKL